MKQLTEERIAEMRNDFAQVKDWFANKIEITKGFFWLGDFRYMGETEKALLVSLYIESLDGEYDTTQLIWIPKSCFLSKAEVEQKNQERENRFENAKANYEKLIAWCKENGVKGVRSGLRTKTIMNKIEEAGLKYAC